MKSKSIQTNPLSCHGLRLSRDKSKTSAKFVSSLNRILTDQNAVASAADRRRFADQLTEAIRYRKAILRLWSSLPEDDIISLIKTARGNGNWNEAIWRCFLATHFGRSSAREEQQIQSASRFLCAFGSKPFWTWKRVTKNPEAFEEWLYSCRDELASIRFGSHRKYESPKPEMILETVESYIALAGDYGSPAKLLKLSFSEPNGFDMIYKRLRPIKRFGRTGCFDFLVLLLDMDLISVEPQQCYLRGATGPRKGARLLWGDLTPKVLDEKAAQLADQLGVSPIVVEDALCNWQK